MKKETKKYLADALLKLWSEMASIQVMFHENGINEYNFELNRMQDDLVKIKNGLLSTTKTT